VIFSSFVKVPLTSIIFIISFIRTSEMI
jgi:hypothetical protein